MDQLTQLKHLLFEQEQESIERLQNRIERPTTRAQDVAEVLADSFNLNEGDDGDLAVAMRSTVSQCISDSVRSDPNSFADALFPVMGPAIRKAVAESIAALAEKINQALDNSLSPRVFKWRFESIRTGIPLSEIILRETLVYRVEEAFVIQRHSGLLIAHEAGEEVASQDSDAVSAMLTVIEDFVRDSFKSEEQSDLDSMNIGGKTVWLFHGPKVTIAGVIRGNPPSDLRETFYNVNEQVHARYGEKLVDFAGDRVGFEGVGQLLSPLVASQSLRNSTAAVKSPYKRLLAISAIFILVVLTLLFLKYRQSSNRDRLIETLNSVTGIEVLDFRESDGAIRIRALRDPLARIAPEILPDHGFNEDEVIIDLISFHSLDPELVLKRAAQILQPPPTVNLDLQGNRLVISGRASAEWTTAARNFPLGISGIEQLDFSGLGLNIEATSEHARQTLEIPDSVDPDFSDGAANAASVLKHIHDVIVIPDSVDIRYADSKLIIAGSAPYVWLANLRAIISQVPYIEGLDNRDFVIAERRELDSLIETNRDFQIFFSSGINIMDESGFAIQDFTRELARIVELDRLLDGVGIRFSITGHTDRTGTDEQNRVMRDKRARALTNLLTDNGVELSQIALADNALTAVDANAVQTRSAKLRLDLISD